MRPSSPKGKGGIMWSLLWPSHSFNKMLHPCSIILTARPHHEEPASAASLALRTCEWLHRHSTDSFFSAGQNLEWPAQQWVCRKWVMKHEGYCYEERRVYSLSNLIFASQAYRARYKGLGYSPLLLSHTLSQGYVSTTLPVPPPAAGAPALQVLSPPCPARTGGRKVVLGRNSVGICACKGLHCRRGERAPGSHSGFW